MSCLLKFKWVKIPRDIMPKGSGLLLDYIRVYAAVAICDGTMRYCQYENKVEEGMWAGGKVGLKSILKARSCADAIDRLQKLSDVGILTYRYSLKTKYLSYKIREEYRVVNTKDQLPVRGKNTYGFVRVPRNIADKLIARNYAFSEADAWIDLWCHTVSDDDRNVFSCFCPCIQIKASEPTLTLETLGARWNWSKAKVQRFFAKNAAYFRLYKLPGSYGCIIFNCNYDENKEDALPSSQQVLSVCRRLQKYGRNRRTVMPDRTHFCRLINMYTGKVLSFFASKSRVALPFINRYISHVKAVDIGNTLVCGRTSSLRNTVKPPEGKAIDYEWIIGPSRRIVRFRGSAWLSRDIFDRILASRLPGYSLDYYTV